MLAGHRRYLLDATTEGFRDLVCGESGPTGFPAATFVNAVASEGQSGVARRRLRVRFHRVNRVELWLLGSVMASRCPHSRLVDFVGTTVKDTTQLEAFVRQDTVSNIRARMKSPGTNRQGTSLRPSTAILGRTVSSDRGRLRREVV